MNHARQHQVALAASVAPAEPPSPPEMARRVALGDFGPEVLAWLTEGFRRHEFDGYALDVALRLDRASRVRVRDDALRRAAALLAIGGAGPWVVAGRLEQAIKHYERKSGPPETPLEIALSAALGSGVLIPDSQQQLRNLLK